MPDGHRVAALDGRVAVLADTSVCNHGHDIGPRFLIKWGYGQIAGKHLEYTDLPGVLGFRSVGESYPDDSAEAEVTFARAECFVRTGELE